MKKYETVTTPASNKQGDDMTEKGTYLYCVAEARGEAQRRHSHGNGNKKLDFGKIGIDDNRVYTVGYKDLLAVVHDCPAVAYDSKDKEMVKKWIMAHQRVVEESLEELDTVLPFSFDTIIQGKVNISSRENVIRWLESDYQKLKEKIDKVRGKAEYGVQIFWDPKIIADKIIQDVPEIKKIDDEMKSKSAGMAYLYEEKLKKLTKKEVEKRADIYFKEFYGQIRSKVADIKIDKTKKTDNNLQMITNLSCLVVKERVNELGQVLDNIQGNEGFSVRFTGPWPAYSFA